nr:protein lava lamp-like isoform X2 [Leptinotarsa decemlineata]
MWKEPDPDPGGDRPYAAQTSRELTELKDQNEQQQLMISQLKEMLRKEQSSVPQEKVDEYINTLSKVKAKRTRLKKDESGTREKHSSTVDINKSEKVNLLKQQMEENKAKLAERGLREKGIEEMVTILKAQFDDSQQLIDSTPGLLDYDKNLEYNKNTSQEELYNILLVKEKKITDLMEKTRKQEGSILDLEENLKEKDSVLEARTKAITLMSDSLSRKSKESLDALDETREQMKKMQEDFIKLENEMKERQMKLLGDLKLKNLQITELQENNEQLVKEKNEYLKHSNNSEKLEDDNYENLIATLQHKLDQTTSSNNQYIEKIADLEKKLEDSLSDINRFKSAGISMETVESNDNEVAKLKKQLDESNKNMIKIKAQSKSKIKELNKKIDAFKKISDANALVVQLQNEITKLNEKIAELEEEKGNMQLKMVDSTDSIKEDRKSEENTAIQEELDRNLKDLEEKDKIISLLETEIISLKEEMKSLNEKMADFSHLKNVQVTTEIQSIQIEEQLDKLESENKELQRVIEELMNEKHGLMEKIEDVTKEKQELNAKLDNYIQENMDLIDKLEKLSAEKVSSAESIEIVEGLTQQEKLELAAYQQTIGGHSYESIKGPEDDNSDHPPELNESVLQLNEDSTELLRKIEMFNMERKEVMLKLEALKDENNSLSLKLNEVENNRDILVETYEQLQNEKEEIQKENEKLKEGIKHSEPVVGGNDSKEDSSTIIKFQELQSHYEEILKENENLKQKLKELDFEIQEKDNLESKLSESKTKIEELETNVKLNLEEINNYQTIIEDNKVELINSASIINELQINLNEKEHDIRELNILMNDLNKVVSDLQKENEKLTNFEIMDKQVNELKTALNEQMELFGAKEQQYKEEIADLESRLSDMNHQLLQTVEVEKKNEEMKMMLHKQMEKDEIIKTLKIQMQEEDKRISGIIEEMKEKYTRLQNQLDGNNDSLEKKVEELSLKNKEQLEKMKKIAANLKRKSQAYSELEEKYFEEKEKWETEINKKESDVSDRMSSLVVQVNNLSEELNKKTKHLEESEFRLKEFSDIIDNLEQQKSDLQNSLLEMKHKQDKISEVSLKQELSSSLHAEFDNLHSSNASTNEDKIKELELIIETNDSDILHFKERVHKLEEDISRLLIEKENLEKQSSALEEKVLLSSKTIEERLQVGEQLSKKLSEVEENNSILVKKLEESEEENKIVNNKFKEQEELINRLKVKLKKAHEKVTQLKATQSSIEEQENVNAELKKQMAHLEGLVKHAHEEKEEMLSKNQRDYEKIESDYQSQLEELGTCKNEITVECEKLKELLKNMQEKEEELISELAEYKQKLQDMEGEYETKILQLTEDLKAANNNVANRLEEINELKHQLDDTQKQIFSQTAKNVVDGVVTEATERVFIINSKETQTEIHETVLVNAFHEKESEMVPTFHWPKTQEFTQTQNCFSNVENLHGNTNISENTYIQQPMEVTKQDLENKIKALEVLLYNVDKEKEEILSQCSGMLNELTRLVYEKVNAPHSDVSQLHSDTKINVPSELEAQILSPEDLLETANDKKTLQQIEFEKCSPSLGQQKEAVVEEVSQPKKAYLTYQVGTEAFGENDDGWGWGPEEAKLEEEHQHQAESTPHVQALRIEITRLNEKLQVFQVERENHLEEIKQLQVKSGKLIKKCKELKQKNDLLLTQKPKKTDNSDFFDLEQTIQEELKSQIASLEKKIKEIHGDLEKEKTEKNHMMKRIDVLSSANEKMVEMKEMQDAEVLRWKRKYEDIEEKLREQEWTSDGFIKGTMDKQSADDDNSSQNCEELQQMIKELSLDNEELQSLLNEQRQLRIEAEKNKNFTRTDEEFIKLSMEFEDKLKNLQKEFSDKCLGFNKTIAEKEKMLEELLGELKSKKDIIQSMEKTFEKLNETNDSLRISLEENIASAKQDQNLQMSIHQKQLEENIGQLKDLLDEKAAAATKIQSSHDEILSLNKLLQEQVEYLTNELENIKQRYCELETTSSDSLEKLQNELESQKLSNSRHVNPNEVNPDVQQLTNNTANTLLELFENFSKANEDYSSLKIQYEEAVNLNECKSDKIHELLQELMDLKREYSEVQNTTSKNISDLQNDLEEQKIKFDLMQTEKTFEINELTKQLMEEKQKNNEKCLEQPSEDLVQQVNDLEGLLAIKEEKIKDLERVVGDLHKQREILDEEIKQLKNDLNEKQKELDNVVAEMEEKFSKTMSELEQKWEVQVDERGNTVAESWKYHLNMVESEFAAVQERLNNEINELEQKCNALVNENNELRKNVDTEIKNEVDRTSAMQQQINDSQQAIKELTERLGEEQIAKVSLSSQVSNLEHERISLKNLLAEKDVELSSLKLIIETTQKQFDEKREVIEEIVKTLERNTSWPLSCEKEEVLNELQRQLSTVNERDKEISTLKEHISKLQSNSDALNDKDKEIVKLNDMVSELENQIVQLKEKNQDILKENQNIEQMQKQLGVLQEKEEEMLRIHKILEDYKIRCNNNQEELNKLQYEKNEAFKTLETYKQNLEELKLHNDSLQSSIEEKNQQIEKLKHLPENLEHAEEEKQKIEMEVSQFRQDYYVLQQSLSECQQQLFQATQELANKAYELENLNQQLAYSQRNSEILDEELNTLKKLSDAKQREYMQSIEEVKQNRISDLENHYREILSSKEMDIQTIRSQLNESLLNLQEVNEKFNRELATRDESQKQLQKKIVEQNSLLEEENNQLSEMRGIIEQQVIKIEQLKEELFQKCNDYDSLIAEMDINRKTITQQPTLNENPGTSTATTRSIAEEDLSDPVSRAELDLALYMLHQRDVRCEELMVELALILEERDTLQLRLSNALRENEETRRKIAKGELTGTEETSSSNLDPTTLQSIPSAASLKDSDLELSSEVQEIPSNQDLANKLLELKRVGYKKDKTFVDEQQLRRYQQMSIMQQHINEASKLPPEAQAKLVDARYTLSRDVQSPSKVLLNWLWGKSTPKVNES